MVAGRSLTDVAVANGTDLSEVSRILPFAFLSPRIAEGVLAGSQPTELTAHRLSRIANLPHSWEAQAHQLGF